MKVFTCKDFKGHWPVGSAAVVIASDESAARSMLLAELEKRGLNQPDPITLSEMNEGVAILCDGNY